MIYFILGIGLVAWFYYVNRFRFRLGTLLFNNAVDDTLDGVLNKCLDSGIKSVETGQYWLTVEFKNGWGMKAWNENKYHGWINQGVIGLYSWSGGRPSVRTMVRLKEEIKKYYVGL